MVVDIYVRQFIHPWWGGEIALTPFSSEAAWHAAGAGPWMRENASMDAGSSLEKKEKGSSQPTALSLYVSGRRGESLSVRHAAVEA